jgi:hypothetical protein
VADGELLANLRGSESATQAHHYLCQAEEVIDDACSGLA